MFLIGKCDFVKYLRDEEFTLRLTYLADKFSRLNELNLYLQGSKGISIYYVKRISISDVKTLEKIKIFILVLLVRCLKYSLFLYHDTSRIDKLVSSKRQKTQI